MDVAAPQQRREAVKWVTLVGVAAILAWRKTDALLNPQLFAEDGAVFFLTAYEQAWLGAWSSPYGGYLHLVPRLIADFAMVFDPRWIPAVYNYTAWVLQVAVAAALFSPRLPLPWSTRPVLALVYALVPHSGEVWLSVTNVHWALALLLVLLVVQDGPRSPAERLRDALLILVLGLSGPFLVFLLPLFALRWWQQRTPARLQLLIWALLVGGVQLGIMLLERETFARTTPVEPLVLMSMMAARVFGTLWGAYRIAIFEPGVPWLFAGVIGVSITTYLAFARGQRRDLRILVAAAALLLTAPVALKFLREAMVIAGPYNGDRYFFQSHVLLAFLLVLACWDFPGWRRWAAAAALVAMVALSLPYQRTAPLPDLPWARYAASIRAGGAIYIPINPGWAIASHGPKVTER